MSKYYDCYDCYDYYDYYDYYDLNLSSVKSLGTTVSKKR